MDQSLLRKKKQELKEAKKKIDDLSIPDFFEKGKDGYHGRHSGNYE